MGFLSFGNLFKWPSPIPSTRNIPNKTVDFLYDEFKHVMVVHPELDADLWEDDAILDAWCKENGCYYLSNRASYIPWDKRWVNDGIGGGDYFFIATNSIESSMLAQMRWG